MPHSSPHGAHWPLTWLLLVSLAMLAPACNALDALDDESKPLPTKREGEIPSTAFVLAGITKTKRKVGGWWAGCLRLGMKRPADDAERDPTISCLIEYGIPMVTEKSGRIGERRAHEIAAEATNHAMATVPRKGRMTAEICREMAKVMMRHVDNALEGSRVNERCTTTLGTLPEVAWP